MAKKKYHPMLACDGTTIEHSADGVKVGSKFLGHSEYLGEIKFDGSRYILQWDEEGKVFFTSRNVSVKDGLPVDKTENLRGYLFDDCQELSGFVLDGEVLVKTNGEFKKGNGSSETNKVMLSSPENAKERLENPDIELVYVVFDFLGYTDMEHRDLTKMPFIERRRLLEKFLPYIQDCLPNSHRVILSEVFEPTQEKLDEIFANGHEGMMLKHKSSPYVQGEHSKHWLKIKRLRSEDGVVIGGQRGTGKYKDTLGALIVGQFVERIGEAVPGILDYISDNDIFGDTPFEFQGSVWYYELLDLQMSLYQLREVCTVSGMDDWQRHSFWSSLKGFLKDGDAEEDEDGNIRLKSMVFSDMQVVEFVAQEKTASRYRHPRFIQVREDKPIIDCIF